MLRGDKSVPNFILILTINYVEMILALCTYLGGIIGRIFSENNIEKEIRVNFKSISMRSNTINNKNMFIIIII
jgi:hypothetical protein